MRRIFLKTRIVAFSFAVAVFASACGSSGSSSSGGASASGVFVVTSDSTTGSFSTVNKNSREATESIGSIHSDAAVRAYGGLVYVINRLNADNIQVLDPNSGYSTTLQFSVGAGLNPQDIAFVNGSKAYVSRYGSAELLIVNPATGKQTGTINLSAYADADGIPEMAQMYITGGKLYVAIQALDRDSFFAPTGQSAVVVIDTATDTVITAISLPFQNPFGAFVKLSNGLLAISCVGSFFAEDGGVATIDTATNTASASSVTEAFLGGQIGNTVFTSNSKGFTIISDSSFNTILAMFDTSAGTVQNLYQTDGFKLLCVATDGDEVWVCDSSDSAPGVQVFDAGNGSQLTGSAISTGLPPRQISFL